MKLSNFIDGLAILRPYYDDPDGFHIGAEHDQFYAYATSREMSHDDVLKMRNLGWFQPAQDDDASPYSVEDGWSAFT